MYNLNAGRGCYRRGWTPLSDMIAYIKEGPDVKSDNTAELTVAVAFAVIHASGRHEAFAIAE
jgi:hypothetical protein